MREQHPDYHIVFIPAGCTGKAQPADVVLQRPLKCGITNQFQQWTTEMLTQQLDPNSDTVPTCEIDHSMGNLKPKLVAWTWESWKQLGLRKEMIVRGWANIGLDAIFTPERQTKALLNLLERNINIDDLSDAKEEDPDSQADGLEREEEEEECDEDNAVEEDEEEVDMDVSIAACLEDREVVQGVRRSGRLASRSDLLRDARMAELMQESMYDDGCVDD
jgi:hypothetical protein